MRDEALWRRLQDYPFDEVGRDLAFEKKLSEDGGWSRGFTKRVIEEYRRFIYLTQVSDVEATPSEPVDRAWHLHLTFSRDYWDRMCAEVLRRPLHHDPCGGPKENPRYEEQYEETRRLYAEEFEAEPPRNIWRTKSDRRLSVTGGITFFLGILVATQVPPIGLAMMALGGIMAIRYGDRGAMGRAMARGAARGGGGGCGGGGCGG